MAFKPIVHTLHTFLKNCCAFSLDNNTDNSSSSTNKSTSTRSTNKNTMPAFGNFSDSQLTTKFHEIKLMEDERVHDAIVHKDKSKWSMQSGVHAFDLDRNRYTNILPYDSTRVRLEVKEGFNDYINASHLTVDLDEPREYIATQGPTKSTITHFWEMVLQQTQPGQDVCIVMVTPLVERNQKKCSKYWTDNVGEVVDLTGEKDGFELDLRLQCYDSHDIGDVPGTHYTMLQLDGVDPATKEVVTTRTIHHIYYDKWTDFMKPEAWEPIHSISNLVGNLKGEDNPLIVHCSAGVGRTGTFITLDYLFHSEELLQAGSGADADADIIEKIIKQLRQQRLLMVQSFDQFKFCYEAVFQFFRDLTTVAPFPARISA